jgi:hypothetical protein
VCQGVSAERPSSVCDDHHANNFLFADIAVFGFFLVLEPPCWLTFARAF